MALAGASAAGASAGGASAGGAAAAGGGAAAASSGGAGVNLDYVLVHRRTKKVRYSMEMNLRSSSQPNLASRTTNHIRAIHTLCALLTQLRIVCNLLCVRCIDDHDLTQLAMRTSRAVQEHGLSRGNRHVESANVRLAILEGNVSAVNAAVHGPARCVCSRLSYCVVAIGELELHNVADGCDDGVGHKGVLRATDDDGDDLVLATMGTS